MVFKGPKLVIYPNPGNGRDGSNSGPFARVPRLSALRSHLAFMR